MFIVTRQDLESSGYCTSRFKRVIVKPIKKPTKEEFYARLFKSLRISNLDEEVNENEHNRENDSQQIGSDQLVPGNSEIVSPETQPPSAKTTHNRFRKFLYKHISNIQASSHAEIDSKHHHGPTRLVNLLLPRYDDFFHCFGLPKESTLSADRSSKRRGEFSWGRNATSKLQA